jgi:hypothetical protein
VCVCVCVCVCDGVVINFQRNEEGPSGKVKSESESSHSFRISRHEDRPEAIACR